MRLGADGSTRHLLVADLGNNLRNDISGELRVDPGTLAPRDVISFEQFNGGLAGQPEAAALVRRFGFQGIIPGF